MKNTEIHVPDVNCSQAIFVENANMSEKEVIASRPTLHSTLLPTRNLPNILRNSNIRANKNIEILESDKMDTYMLLNTEHTNTSFELNTPVSSIDPEKKVNYSKIALPKSHHPRKQVHNPLNAQYDASPDCNNKRLLQKVDRVDALHDLPNQEMKNLRCNNKTNRRLDDRKPKKINPCKSGNETKGSNEKSNVNLEPIAIPDVNMNDKVVILKNVDYFLDDDTFIQPVCGSDTDTSNTNRSCTNKNNVRIGSEEPFDIPYYNNEACNLKGTYNINYNSVLADGLTEFNTTQHKVIQSRFTNNESPAIDDLQEGLMDGDVTSNYLFESKVLYTCTCMNCTSYDKDFVFYEEPVSALTNSDRSETELYTSSLCDFYSDYYHIFDDNWLKESNESLYCEEVDGINTGKENAYTDCYSVAEVIENNANTLSIKQSELDAQPCHNDKTQDTAFETYSTGSIAHYNPSKRSLKCTQNVEDLDEIKHSRNLRSTSMEKSKATFQNEAFAQNAARAPLAKATAARVSVFKSKHKRQKKKQDVYIIRCASCGKLFNERRRFRKHFTRCKFDKEDFKCHICDRMYKYKSSLIHHLRKIHNVSKGSHEKYYICSKCSKSYIRFRSFQRHVLLHDD